MHAELQLDNQICFRLYTVARLITQAYTPMLIPAGMGETLKACPLQMDDYTHLASELDSIIEALKR